MTSYLPQTITSCHCSTNLCNSDLAEAGYTGQQSDTTAASSEAIKVSFVLPDKCSEENVLSVTDVPL